MKIAIGIFMHESNTFSSKLTTLDVWKTGTWIEDPARLMLESGDSFYPSGIYHIAQKNNVELIPIMVCNNSGPTITAECYKQATDMLLERIAPHAGKLDGICISLHGGAAVQGMDDVETDILKQIHALVGNNIPITMAMDLHGNIGSEMKKYCTAFLCGKEYPHIDMDQALTEALDILVRTIKGSINPVMGFCKLPMLFPPACGCTFEEPAKSIKEYFDEYKQAHNLLDCSFYQGFPFSDIPCSSASVAVTADGDAQKAQTAANELAMYVWSRRMEFLPEYNNPTNGIESALSINEGLVVINETSDNPGGGAPCDGTHTLKVLLAKNLPGTCFAVICDPGVAEAAHSAGAGSSINVLLGGKTDTIHGDPLSVDATVVCITNGSFTDNSPMSMGIAVNLGKCARLKIGNVDVIVTSLPYQTLGDGVCVLHGIDVRKLRLLCIKSSQHFKAFYKPIAKAIITVDPPGIHTSNLSLLSYHNVKRPIYPLDKETEFHL